MDDLQELPDESRKVDDAIKDVFRDAFLAHLLYELGKIVHLGAYGFGSPRFGRIGLVLVFPYLRLAEDPIIVIDYDLALIALPLGIHRQRRGRRGERICKLGSVDAGIPIFLAVLLSTARVVFLSVTLGSMRLSLQRRLLLEWAGVRGCNQGEQVLLVVGKHGSLEEYLDDAYQMPETLCLGGLVERILAAHTAGVLLSGIAGLCLLPTFGLSL
jgi:hypothetical protein